MTIDVDVSDDDTKNYKSNCARRAKMIFPSGRGAGFKSKSKYTKNRNAANTAKRRKRKQRKRQPKENDEKKQEKT